MLIDDSKSTVGESYPPRRKTLSSHQQQALSLSPCQIEFHFFVSLPLCDDEEGISNEADENAASKRERV